MATDRFCFRPEERINLDREIQYILENGKRVRNGSLTLFWIARRDTDNSAKNSSMSRKISKCRFAMRLDRSFPNAVWRNRVKRIFREIFRKEKWHISPSNDLLLLIQPCSDLKQFSFQKMREEFISLCVQAELWHD